MGSLLVKNIACLVSMVDGEADRYDQDVLILDGKINAIGSNLQLPEGRDIRVVDGSRCVAYPGFINTHHHLYQTLTRNLPRVQNAKLFDWLRALYEVWRELDEEAVDISTQVGIGELLLSGCTTTTDHFYLFPSKATPELLDIEIDTARRMGIRFHPTRGSMSRGKSGGGLPPDDVIQTPDTILADCERLIAKYHDPDPFSMCRIVLAPCSPFSVTTDLLTETAAFARERKVHLHTHLCETKDEEDYCLQTCGMRPLDYMEKTGWVGGDVWYAHGIYFNDDELKRLAETGTGIAHCPGSNLRLGSGIARVPEMLDMGVRIGIGVDGSSSNDSSSFLREMQLAMLVHRVGTGVDAMPPRRVLEMATRNGAAIFGQPEIGQLQVGAAGDLALFDLHRIEFAGAMADPASAILFCGGGQRASYTIVAGEILVEQGRLCCVDEEEVVQRANAASKRMIQAAEANLGVSYH